MSNDIYHCQICSKTFKSAHALSGHSRMHGSSNGRLKKKIHLCQYCHTSFVNIKTHSHNCRNNPSNIKHCLNCDDILTEKNSVKFCSNSCSASFNNKKRITGQWSAKVSSRIKKKSSNRRRKKSLPSGPYSKVFHCNCAHCQTKFISRIKKKYCSTCKDKYSYSSKQGYKFTFNVYHYPDLFDLSLIEKHGWFSPGGKTGKWNMSGVSRDHKISVTEAIKNNYDPYYITHPLNCELMLHHDNNKKKTKSSITYEELCRLVDNYR